MMKAVLIFAALGFLLAPHAEGQNGGKAEPRLVAFAAGANRTTLRGSLKNGEEMEYVFAARKGQQLTIRNPGTLMFDVRVFSDEFGVETEFDSSREFSITVPESGNYMLFVRKKMVRDPAKARFAVEIRIG